MQEPPFQLLSQPLPEIVLEVCNISFLENGPYSFVVGAGECIGISGASGIGKTQLLRAIADLIPYSGTIRLGGRDCAHFSPTVWRKKVGMVPADPHWWYDRVGDHFVTPKKQKHLLNHLNLLGFENDVLDWEVSRLSTGERQRLALVRALILDPVVLLLDEPTSALDPYHTSGLEKLISSLQHKNQMAVIWVSHDAAQLERVTRRVLIVGKKELRESDGV